jgi:hypothetical protein
MRRSGQLPEYRLLNDAELLLTLYSADLPNQFLRIIEARLPLLSYRGLAERGWQPAFREPC